MLRVIDTSSELSAVQSDVRRISTFVSGRSTGEAGERRRRRLLLIPATSPVHSVVTACRIPAHGTIFDLVRDAATEATAASGRQRAVRQHLAIEEEGDLRIDFVLTDAGVWQGRRLDVRQL